MSAHRVAAVAVFVATLMAPTAWSFGQPASEVGVFLQQVAIRTPPLPGGARATVAIAGPSTAGTPAGADVHVIAGGTVFRYAGLRWEPVRGLPGPAIRLARVGDSLVAAGAHWVAQLPSTAARSDTSSATPTSMPLPERTDVIDLPSGPVLRVVARDHLLTREGTAWRRLPLPAGTSTVAQSSDGRLTALADGALFEMSDGQSWVSIALRNATEGWQPPGGVSHVAYDTRGRLWFASAQGVGVRDGPSQDSWRFIDAARGLPVPGITSMAAGPDGDMWLGTSRGAVRLHDGGVEYRQGRRWLPGDQITATDVDASGRAWFATPAGVGGIDARRTTLADKATAYEDAIAKHHRRTPYGYVVEAHLARPGDPASAVTTDNDNDGLWTAMYGAGECFAYAATGRETARTRARRAFEALRFLSIVTQGGQHAPPPGFPARSISPTSGPDPNTRDNPTRDRARQATIDAKWKVLDPRWPVSADRQWYWKTDTSSDELDGHYFFYALYHDLVAQDAAEQQEVAEVVRAMTDHLLAHDYALVDHDGTPTRWGVFGPTAINHDRTWHEERGLNSLSMLTYLRIAEHVTGDDRYAQAARVLIDTHGYAMNLLHPKSSLGVGGGNQSDDEMAFMNYYHLLQYEQDPEVRQAVAQSLHTYWQLERPERNPFFNLVAAIGLEGATFRDAFGTEDLSLAREAWLEDTLDSLRRFPVDLVDWGLSNSHRLDVRPLPDHVRPGSSGRHGVGLDGKVLPVDERMVFHWNVDPYQFDYPGTGARLADGTSFLLPYYMALYHRVIVESRKADDAAPVPPAPR